MGLGSVCDAEDDLAAPRSSCALDRPWRRPNENMLKLWGGYPSGSTSGLFILGLYMMNMEGFYIYEASCGCEVLVILIVWRWPVIE